MCTRFPVILDVDREKDVYLMSFILWSGSVRGWQAAEFEHVGGCSRALVHFDPRKSQRLAGHRSIG
jgi:hypothetical protein